MTQRMEKYDFLQKDMDGSSSAINSTANDDFALVAMNEDLDKP
ncbi:4158_t:CDS:2, partial [Entrophospora sp. SA101]